MGAALFHADRLREEWMDRHNAVNCPFSKVLQTHPETLHFARTVHLFR